MKYIIARCIALLLILLPVADYWLSGDIAISNVYFATSDEKNAATITLPYSLTYSPKESKAYTLEFYLLTNELDKFRTITFNSQACVTSMTVNVKPLPHVLPSDDERLTFGPNGPREIPPLAKELADQAIKSAQESTCISKGIIPIESSKSYNAIKLSFLADPAVTDTMSVVRSQILDPLQIFIMELLAVYLLARSTLRTKNEIQKFHYVFLVLGIFTFTSFPIFDDIKGSTRIYIGFIGQTCFMIMLMAISLYSHTLRDIYDSTAKFIKKIETLPPYLFVPLCMILFGATACFLSWVLFDHLPHVADSHAQYMHSKIIASGHFTEVTHPLKKFFNLQNVYNYTYYYSHYPPGHLLMLAIGQVLHLPWIINPVLGALTVGAIYLLANEIAGRSAGYIAAALTLITPFMLFMSAEYMNHATALLFLTLGIFAYIRFHKYNDWRMAALCGLSMGYAFISRPQAFIFFAIPVAIHGFHTWDYHRRERTKKTLLLILCSLIPVAFFLYYNAATNGDPLVPNQGSNATNYFTSVYDHLGWQDFCARIRRIALQTGQMHIHLFGWTTSSFIFVTILYLFRAQPPYATLLLACCFCQLLGLFFIPYFDMIFGPRYLYETTSCFIVLTAICLQRLPSIITQLRLAPWPTQTLQGMTAIMVVTLFTLGLPFAIKEKYIYYHNDYWEGNAEYYHSIMSSVEKPAIVFVRTYPDFRLFFFTAPPHDDNPVIFAWDLGEENQELMDYYPKRAVYKFDGGFLERVK